jgi:phosphotransferase system  glucose/maltose/N-acetylglucosamine-specific IIC component
MNDKTIKIAKIVGANALIVGTGSTVAYFLSNKFKVHPRMQPILFFGAIGIAYTMAVVTDSMWRDKMILTPPATKTT